MTLDQTTIDAVELADTDTLLRAVDGMCSRRAWDDLATLRLHLEAAVERGRQVWGVDEHIRYRFALEAPPELAIPVVAEGPARFTLGPLTEVVSQRNRYEDLGPHLEAGTIRSVIAHERAIRGDEVDPSAASGVFDIPLWMDWEPHYRVPEYKSDRADFPTPPPVAGEPLELPAAAERIDDDPTEEALLALVTPWVTTSNGVTDLAVVEGPALAAIAALGAPRPTGTRVTVSTMMEWMAWCAASGGAYGRRRGGAAGRFLAWSAIAALAGLDWPVDPAQLREAAESMEWWMWDDGATAGWVLKIAVHDPADGLSWAFAAADAKDDESDQASTV